MQAPTVELLAGKQGTLRGALSAPPILPATKTFHHEGIHLIELPVGIARPKVIPPAAKHGRQFRDNLLHVLPVLSPAGDLVDALAEFLRRLGARPPLHKMPAWVPLDAPLFTNRASQEYKALVAAS